MREYPILLNDAMAQATWEGRKTATVRPAGQFKTLKPGDRLWVRECFGLVANINGRDWEEQRKLGRAAIPSPQISPNDESCDFAVYHADGLFEVECANPDCRIKSHRIPGRSWDHVEEPVSLRWRPLIHMPRWAARTVVTVTEVWEAEWGSARFRDPALAQAEGFASVAEFRSAVESIYGGHRFTRTGKYLAMYAVSEMRCIRWDPFDKSVPLPDVPHA